MEDTKMMTENAEKLHQINGIKIGYTEKKITSYGAILKPLLIGGA